MAPQDTPSRKLDQYIVRFPEGMRDVLKAEAEKNKRSMNAEIVHRLERTLEMDSFQGENADYLEHLASAAGDEYVPTQLDADLVADENSLDRDIERAIALATTKAVLEVLKMHGVRLGKGERDGR
ncbi:Arc family DNA-binding protein [Devosia sp. 1635]|uniref:Arc family DNA-binding protein n=1 Tax=Devosia sp. 1635 TaxID=2726066 RepID=UPI0015650446|nr:Arc family DNA-binding protein [Devosia sp. 1635]